MTGRNSPTDERKFNFLSDAASEWHKHDIAALEMMKEMERKRAKRMVSVRIDDKTVVCADKKRIKELVAAHGGQGEFVIMSNNNNFTKFMR